MGGLIERLDTFFRTDMYQTRLQRFYHRFAVLWENLSFYEQDVLIVCHVGHLSLRRNAGMKLRR